MPRVAVIYLNEETNLEQTAFNLIDAAKRNEILGILLIINHFGGLADLFSVLHDVTKRITAMKPVIGLIAGSAISGGYMVASATDYIIAHSCSDIGHIGVVHTLFQYRNPKKMGEVEASLAVENFRAGEFKTVYSNYSEELSPQEKQHVQESVNKSYAQFLEMVAQNRKLKIENYKEWADGKAFIASEALQLGLIDEIGTIFEAEGKMLELISKRNPNNIFAKKIDPVFYAIR